MSLKTLFADLMNSVREGIAKEIALKKRDIAFLIPSERKRIEGFLHQAKNGYGINGLQAFNAFEYFTTYPQRQELGMGHSEECRLKARLYEQAARQYLYWAKSASSDNVRISEAMSAYYALIRVKTNAEADAFHGVMKDFGHEVLALYKDVMKVDPGIIVWPPRVSVPAHAPKPLI